MHESRVARPGHRSLLTSRRHIDLQLVTSALCPAA
ncbi:hypothetical protein SAMN06273567_103425 [Geodermatophilus aquaeductus]|uniref:Uncharacterized protein n=1 Tax=Geodermatophilus aquaeductus TaxID=1564161 RepID=A0A521DSD2_9ACTN|nr:hypothetical protein SAMN06273567_103425 [Geodermatophilus aquaeductus]